MYALPVPLRHFRERAMIATLAPAFRYWIGRAKNIALLAAVGAGCVYGYAYAISPTINADREYVSSISPVQNVDGNAAIYVVPAGRRYTITDVIITNTDLTTVNAHVYAEDGSCTGNGVRRLNMLFVPGQSTLHLPLNTGITFAAGKPVCVGTDGPTQWNVRGYLSNAT